MSHPRWFTLIELLIACSIIAIGLLTIIGLMQTSISYTDRTRQETIAINIAREWMETVYTIRNTNRLRWSGKRDANRLCADSSLEANTGASSCGAWIQSGISYTIRLTWSDSSLYPYLSGTAYTLDLKDNIPDDIFLLYYGTWNHQHIPMRYQWWSSSQTTAEWSFYREIRGLWLYQKNIWTIPWGNAIICNDGWGTYTAIDSNGITQNNQSCANGEAKEFRFCSKVEYQKKFQWKVELCGVLTNYRE